MLGKRLAAVFGVAGAILVGLVPAAFGVVVNNVVVNNATDNYEDEEGELAPGDLPQATCRGRPTLLQFAFQTGRPRTT